MTEIQLQKQIFLSTLKTIQSQFELASTSLTLETDEAGERFSLTAERKNAGPVQAFGPCKVIGQPVNVAFDMADLEAAIVNATVPGDTLSLLIGDGLWVKEVAETDDEDK